MMNKFSINPNDGDRIIDQYGVLWIYDLRSKTWINMGFVDVYSNVTEDSDGLVYPSLFELLDSIDPEKFRGLKILDNTKASFYYLYSSDNTIKFRYEEHLGEIRLRAEINQSVLSKKFREFRCKGPKGEQGDKGEQGNSGLPAANEPIYSLDIGSGLVNIEVNVATPIDTPVSLRLFRSQIQIGEFLIYEDGEVDYEFIEGYSIKDGTTSNIYIDDNILYAEFELDGDLDGTWTYKARQIGPKGKQGDGGNWFLVVEHGEISDDNLESDQIVYEISKEGVNIAYNLSSVGDNICAVGLIPGNPNDFKFNLTTTRLLSARYMSSNCRDIVNWEYSQPELIVPELDIPQWTPTECCPKTRVSFPPDNEDEITGGDITGGTG
ncbi:MAG: hypothetical protein GF411_01780 [Candidatus Lokiarchaeota archaeon]|nr:hypothetical protein [Candidatus Lokiarchaeota archaeon]